MLAYHGSEDKQTQATVVMNRYAEKEGVVQLNELGESISIQHVFELVLRLKQITNFDPLTGENEMEQAGMWQDEAQVAVDPNNPRTWDKVARNSPCPCGSGRKYKHCHGALS